MRLAHGWIIALLAVLGCLMSLALSRAVAEGDRHVRESQFGRDAADRARLIEREVAKALAHVRTLAAFYVGSNEVTRDEFHAFAGRIMDDQRLVRALEWIPLVPAADRADFERSVGAQIDGFEIVEADGDKLVRAAERSVYYPVTFIEPTAGNEAALGLDLGSEPTRRAALELARDTGDMTVTPGLELVQGGAGVLVALPLFTRGSELSTVAMRREQLEGFVLGVIVVGDLVDAALTGIAPAGVDIRVYEEAAPAGERLLYTHASRTRGLAGDDLPEFGVAPGGHLLEESLAFADRVWTVRCTPTAAYVDDRGSAVPLLVLAGGLVLTGLLIAYLLAVTGRASRVEMLVEARTRELEAHADELEHVNAELERFNRLAVGRERRMIELKRRINEMLEAQGQEAPYDLAAILGEAGVGDEA